MGKVMISYRPIPVRDTDWSRHHQTEKKPTSVPPKMAALLNPRLTSLPRTTHQSCQSRGPIYVPDPRNPHPEPTRPLRNEKKRLRIIYDLFKGI